MLTLGQCGIVALRIVAMRRSGIVALRRLDSKHAGGTCWRREGWRRGRPTVPGEEVSLYSRSGFPIAEKKFPCTRVVILPSPHPLL